MKKKKLVRRYWWQDGPTYEKDFEEYLPCFVYGTLREGFGNYRRLLHGKVESIKPATVKGIIHSVDKHGYGFPCLFDQKGTVYGELMYIKPSDYLKVMLSVDELEGNGYMYKRKKVQAVDTEGNEITAWVYYWLCGKDGIGRRIPGGDWAKHMEPNIHRL